MRDIFHPQTVADLKTRINNINSNAEAQWGKMNVYQMLKHCTENEKLLLREKKFRRIFMGRIFGKMALKSNIKDDNPMDKNNPTHPELKITGTGNVETEKQLWITLLDQYLTKKAADYTDFVHPFFGKMNSEQVSRFAFKHIDHHLRQFGV